MKRILLIAKSIFRPFLVTGKEHELDELCTYLLRKRSLLWVVYALRKDTGEVVDFTVGSRSNKVLNRVVQTLLLSSSKRICTDRLLQYKSLIPESIQDTRRRGTNHIERMNLNLRTHLKRLNRWTICYSKSFQPHLKSNMVIRNCCTGINLSRRLDTGLTPVAAIIILSLAPVL